MFSRAAIILVNALHSVWLIGLSVLRCQQHLVYEIVGRLSASLSVPQLKHLYKRVSFFFSVAFCSLSLVSPFCSSIFMCVFF